MADKILSLVIPDALYKKLQETYEDEGYSSVHDFIIDIVRDKLMIREKGKGTKIKKEFMDYFSRGSENE